MSSKKETQFSQSFNNFLIKFLEKPLPEKMTNLFRAGVPDYYIDLNNGNFGWFEYKYIKHIWTNDKPAEKLFSTVSWIHQLTWLKTRHKRNIKTGVIVGAPKSATLLLYPYDFIVEQHIFEPRKLVAQKLIQYLNEN